MPLSHRQLAAIFAKLRDQGAPSGSSREKRLESGSVGQVSPYVPGGKYTGRKDSSYIVNLRGGQKAIFKSISTGGRREVIAYKVSQILGFPEVPPTALRTLSIEGKQITGSLQHWAQGESGKLEFGDAIRLAKKQKPHSTGELAEPVKAQGREIAVFDYLIANWDRTQGNILWDARRNRILAIDHGSAFDTDEIERARAFGGYTRSPLKVKATSKDHFYWHRLKNVLEGMPGSQKKKVSGRLDRFLAQEGKMLDEGNKIPGTGEKYAMDLEAMFDRARYLREKIREGV